MGLTRSKGIDEIAKSKKRQGKDDLWAIGVLLMRLLGASQMALMQLVRVVRDIQTNKDSESSLGLQKKYEEILRELETCGVDMEILKIVFEKDPN